MTTAVEVCAELRDRFRLRVSSEFIYELPRSAKIYGFEQIQQGLCEGSRQAVQDKLNPILKTFDPPMSIRRTDKACTRGAPGWWLYRWDYELHRQRELNVRLNRRRLAELLTAMQLDTQRLALLSPDNPEFHEVLRRIQQALASRDRLMLSVQEDMELIEGYTRDNPRVTRLRNDHRQSAYNRFSGEPGRATLAAPHGGAGDEHP